MKGGRSPWAWGELLCIFDDTNKISFRSWSVLKAVFLLPGHRQPLSAAAPLSPFLEVSRLPGAPRTAVRSDPSLSGSLLLLQIKCCG